MKVLYIHQYFKTPDEYGTSRSYWFAKKLVDNGVDVTMITSTNKYKHPNPERCVIDGINVVYVKNEYSQYFSKLRKLWSFAKFFYKAVIQSLKEKDVDIIYATSTPLTVGAIALVIQKIKKWRYIFEVRDLWPEFPIQIGAIKNKSLIKILKNLEKSIYKHSEHIVVLSPGMADGVISTGISIDKITIVPNMSKVDIYYPREHKDETFQKFGIDITKFNLVHAGSMGPANGLMSIMESAKYLQIELNNSEINFIMVGDGSTKPQLEDFVKTNNLHNVKFIGQYASADMSEIYNCCDASLTSFKDLPILYTNSPNKLFDSLSAGKPIIVNSAGWTKDLVEEYHCGFYVNPNIPKDLAIKLEELSHNPILQKKFGDNARHAAETVFDKSILVEKFYSVIMKELL